MWVRQDVAPAWLRVGETLGKEERGRAYYRKIWQQTPPWATRESIMAVYSEAARRRACGMDVQVDHIVPLKSNWVCGLHCAENLQIIPRIDNARKSNRWHEQLQLFEVEQLRLF